jgi:apolipoprotein N-acyltransferase
MWMENMETIRQVRQAGPFSLIYGLNELEADLNGENLVQRPKGRAFNSLVTMTPEDDLQSFRKRHLVIFGETIPFVDSLPWLKKIYEQQSGQEFGGSFSPGDSLDPLPMNLNGTPIGIIPSICFEDTVPRLTRRFVRPGPQIIVNVTNDGWFKESPAAAQHFANARFRAIELRRPMLRCANSGVSAAIHANGSTSHPDTGKPQILRDQNGNHFTRGSLLAEIDIPLQPGFSLYAIIGDWGIILIALSGLSIAWLTRRAA